MKRVLIISPHFPPINAPDMQRVRMSLPYYRAQGWEPVVLAVGEAWQQGVSEPELSATVPADVRVFWSRAVPLWLARRFGIGNLGLRAWPFLWRAGSRLLRREKFDLVFFSNTQVLSFTLGPLWRRRFGVPYVIDLQDPWRTDHYERPGSRPPPGGWKYLAARLQARWLEGWVFKRASGFISVSPDYLESLKKRYPSTAGTPGVTLAFGASRDDLAHARTLPAPGVAYSRAQGERHLVYTGASGPIAPRALDLLFQGLQRYREREPARAGRLRLHFVGTSYLAPGEGTPTVLAQAAACGVGDLVAEVPHRIGFFESLRLQQEADALLLLGSADPAYSPSKIYIYYLAARPMLGLVFTGSVMERLLDELACAVMLRVAPSTPDEEVFAGLHRWFDRIVADDASVRLPPRNDDYFNAHFLAEELTRQQCALFETALRPAPTA